MKKKYESYEAKMIQKFINMMKTRFKNGREQYGMDYLMKDQITDIQEELVDTAVYAMLLFIKVEILRKICVIK